MNTGMWVPLTYGGLACSPDAGPGLTPLPSRGCFLRPSMQAWVHRPSCPPGSDCRWHVRGSGHVLWSPQRPWAVADASSRLCPSSCCSPLSDCPSHLLSRGTPRPSFPVPPVGLPSSVLHSKGPPSPARPAAACCVRGSVSKGPRPGVGARFLRREAPRVQTELRRGLTSRVGVDVDGCAPSTRVPLVTRAEHKRPLCPEPTGS